MTKTYTTKEAATIRATLRRAADGAGLREVRLHRGERLPRRLQLDHRAARQGQARLHGVRPMSPLVNGVWVPEPAAPRRTQQTRQQSFAGAYAALAEICRVRPLTQWPGARTKDRKRSTFSAPWGRSVKSLGDELRLVKAKDAVLQVEIEERFFRIDGLPRADARASGPGVVLSFSHPAAGALMYPCDRFDKWQDNVHALALSLEALRAVDRYGVTKNAEQYRGWKALPASTDAPMDRDEAARVICAEAGLDVRKAELVRDSRVERATAIRQALMNTHPDQGGKVDAFHRVQRARKALETV